MYKLDNVDRKVLFELEIDARQPYSSIAKKIKTSKEVIRYRIERMKEQGLIQKFLSIVNLSLVGLEMYKFYFNLQNIKEGELNQMINDLNKKPQVMWIALCDGKYDLILMVASKDNFEANKILQEIRSQYNLWIKEACTLNYIEARHQKRTYLIEKRRSTESVAYLGGKPKNFNLDEYEIKTLGFLTRDARVNIVDIANSIDCSVDVIHKRIKKLMQKGIISGSRIMINRSLIGYQYHKILLKLKNFESKREKELFSYLYQNQNIVDVIKMMGVWDLELDVDVKNSGEFHKIIMGLKNKFSDLIDDYESLLVFKEYKYDFFPMKEKFDV